MQAGGKGTRLEWLTRNKPKCLVPVNNLPIIFHLFKKFKDSHFIIIADYKIDVLEKYLKTFAQEYSYQIIQALDNGTISGISEAIAYIDDNEYFMIVWCDLILSNNFILPQNTDKNYIGISKDFECRWQYKNNRFINKPSRLQGVAGLFIFKNKDELIGIPQNGALVEWLSKQNLSFSELSLNGSVEIGTLLSYDISTPPYLQTI